MKHTDFARAFEDGATFTDALGSSTVRPHHVGQLVVPSGRLVACDPLAALNPQPFQRDVPPGRYPIILSIAHFERGDQRVACAKLQFSDGIPARWEMATRPGQDLTTLREGEFFGYAVDSGTGSFMDAEAARALGAKDDDYGRWLVEELQERYVHTWTWMDVTLEPISGANLVAFSSGYGDGYYASYWGYNKDDNLVSLVTDFDILGLDS